MAGGELDGCHAHVFRGLIHTCMKMAPWSRVSTMRLTRGVPPPAHRRFQPSVQSMMPTMSRPSCACMHACVERQSIQLGLCVLGVQRMMPMSRVSCACMHACMDRQTVQSVQCVWRSATATTTPLKQCTRPQLPSGLHAASPADQLELLRRSRRAAACGRPSHRAAHSPATRKPA
jgi:hypothetical protein